MTLRVRIAALRDDKLLSVSIMALVVRVGTAAVVFGFSVLVARLLGVDDSGLFFLGLSIVSVATVLGRAGLDHSLVRFVATAADTGQWDKVRGVARLGISIGGVVALAISALTWWLAPEIATGIFDKPRLAAPLRIVALGIAPLSLILLYGQLLKGMSRVTASLIVSSALVPALAGLAAMFLSSDYGLNGVAASWSGATIVALLIAAWLWYRLPDLRRASGSHFAMETLLASAHPLLWQSLASILVRWSSPLMLGIWGTAAHVAQFTAASRTALLTSLLLAAAESVIAPQFAALYARGEIEQLEKTARKVSALLALAAAPVCAVLVIAPQQVLSLFGDGFAEGAPALALLAVAQFVNVSAGASQYLLVMCGQEKTLRNITIAAAASVVLLNVLLIPTLGLYGAAIAFSITMAGQNLVAVWMVKRRMGIWPLPVHW